MSSYFGQFKIFNPISGDLPNTPFSILPAIAIRARNILKSRTVDQIESVAEAIDYAIYSYFNEIKENEIYRLKKILVELKYPKQATFVKQANIAHGHQQVNNATNTHAHAREKDNQPNELLEVNNGSTTMDSRTAQTTIPQDKAVATVAR